jgi:anti-anti-sigma factor
MHLRWDAGTLHVIGELDLFDAPRLVHEVHPTDVDSDVRLDLSGLEFVDLGGVRALLEVAAAARSKGFGTRLLNPTRMVSRVLDLVGVERYDVEVSHPTPDRTDLGAIA